MHWHFRPLIKKSTGIWPVRRLSYLFEIFSGWSTPMTCCSRNRYSPGESDDWIPHSARKWSERVDVVNERGFRVEPSLPIELSRCSVMHWRIILATIFATPTIAPKLSTLSLIWLDEGIHGVINATVLIFRANKLFHCLSVIYTTKLTLHQC